jgi:hypothetical protein
MPQKMGLLLYQIERRDPGGKSKYFWDNGKDPVTD